MKSCFDGKLSAIARIAESETLLAEEKDINSMDMARLKELSKRLLEALSKIDKIARESAEILREAGDKAGLRGKIA